MRLVKIFIIACALFMISSSCEESGPLIIIKDKSGNELTVKSRQVIYAIDCDFPQNMINNVRDGFYYWNTIIGRDMFVESASCGVVSLLPTDSLGVLIIYNESLKMGSFETFADTSINSGRSVSNLITMNYYLIWSSTNRETRISVVRHEAGHVLGMHHSSDASCLMYKTIDPLIYSNGFLRDACDIEKAFVRKTYQ